MKILKIKFGLLSLLVLTFCVFLTSCEQGLPEAEINEIQVSDLKEVSTDELLGDKVYSLKVPKEIDKGDIEIWLSSLSKSEIIELNDNYVELEDRAGCGNWITQYSFFWVNCGHSHCWGWDKMEFGERQYRYCDVGNGWFYIQFREQYGTKPYECHVWQNC